jgi:HSP20 family protein
MALAVHRRPDGGRSRQPQRWTPFRDLSQLDEQTAQLFQSVLGEAPPALWAPPVDIEETEDAWIFEAEVPGVDRKDLNVDVNGNELAITGEIKEKERKGVLRHRTRRVGEFEFRVVLPQDVDPENIQADLDDGMLIVRVPKADTSRSRHIEVGRGEASGDSTTASEGNGGAAGSSTGS